ncbi:MAG: sigma-70 family RNA polymerase sigma factor [Planctomycetota bacterium]|jgi:RNA polymerase sigma-70 factor (ECF subfamily)
MNRAERNEMFEREALPHLDSFYHMALRMTQDSSSAEDLVQETMLKVFKNLHTFQPGTNFRAWVFRILTNNYINEYRRRKRGPQSVDFTEMDPAEPVKEPAYFTVEDLAQFREQIGDAAANALDKVPHDFRLVFLLATFEDFSYKEIADIVGIPVGTVMSRLFRARQILRKELSEYSGRGKAFKETEAG